MTPFFIGRVATMLPGVRPIIFLASSPTATTSPVFLSTATTEGSPIAIPLPSTYTFVFAVPKSIPICLLPNNENTMSNFSFLNQIFNHQI